MRTACMRVPAVIIVVYRRDGDAAGMARSIIVFRRDGDAAGMAMSIIFRRDGDAAGRAMNLQTQLIYTPQYSAICNGNY
jgi:hypothetical protein